MSFYLKSSAFQIRDYIPKKYSGEDKDISPPLNWSEPPAGTKSYVLILNDPDAPGGDFVHWAIFNIPAKVMEIPEGVKLSKVKGAMAGTNSFGQLDYGGPCPPPGKPHRYTFTIFALNSVLALHEGASKPEITAAMEGHVLAGAQLIGLYKR